MQHRTINASQSTECSTLQRICALLGAGVRRISVPASAVSLARLGWSGLLPAAQRRRFLKGKEHGSMAASVILQSRADQALRQSPIPALRKLSVEETDQDVVL